LWMKDGEEAPRDHVEDPFVVGAHLVDRVLGAGRDDRVVICDLGVVYDAGEWQQVEPGDVLRRRAVLRLRAYQLRYRLDLGDHVAGQVARVRAGIGERLVLLVAALRRSQRALGREAVAVVGLALERRQVIQQRRFLALLFALQLADRAERALGELERAAARLHDRLGLGLGGDAGTARFALPARAVVAPLIGALGVRGEVRVDELVRLGLKG